MSEQKGGCTAMGPDEFYADLDEGIRFAVKVLHAHGIDTCQSCEGGPGHSYPAPTVDMRGSAHEQPAFAALHHLETYGLEVCSLSQVWNVAQGRIYETVWRIELRRPCPERADEWPMFVWSSSSLDRSEAERVGEFERAIVEYRTATSNAGSVKVQPGYEEVAEAKHRADERLWKQVGGQR